MASYEKMDVLVAWFSRDEINAAARGAGLDFHSAEGNYGANVLRFSDPDERCAMHEALERALDAGHWEPPSRRCPRRPEEEMAAAKAAWRAAHVEERAAFAAWETARAAEGKAWGAYTALVLDADE